MRTTVALPDDLLSKARKEALETGRSLAVLVEEALREKLARRPGRAGSTGSSPPCRVSEPASPVRLLLPAPRATGPFPEPLSGPSKGDRLGARPSFSCIRAYRMCIMMSGRRKTGDRRGGPCPNARLARALFARTRSLERELR